VIVVVMGVAGSGKSTVGRLLANRLGVPYADGDGFHPAANIAKMSEGVQLGDADRLPWLRAIAGWISEHSSGVVSCSALKRRYRDVLREPGAPLWFLHLAAGPSVITGRVAARPGHFMPAALVASQYDALEPLAEDEPGLLVNAADAPDPIVDLVTAALTARKVTFRLPAGGG
jgi:gluconokinase